MVLLETTLTILMAGLMTHIGDDRIAGKDLKSHVLIVEDQKDKKHQAFLGVVELAGSSIFIYPLEHDDAISFDGFAGEGAEATRQFQDFTPSLAEPITNALLADAPLANKKHANVAASLKYPNGTLCVASFHEYQLELTRSDINKVRTQCVPEFTAFKAVAPEEITVKITNPRKTAPTEIILSGDVLLLLVNPVVDEHDEPSNQEAADHFSNYMGILQRRSILLSRQLAVAKISNAPCHEVVIDTCGDVLHQLFGRQAALLHGPAASSRLRSLLDILISTNPACTNTDWP